MLDCCAACNAALVLETMSECEAYECADIYVRKATDGFKKEQDQVVSQVFLLVI